MNALAPIADKLSKLRPIAVPRQLARRTAAADQRRRHRLALQDLRPPREMLEMHTLAPIADKLSK